MKYHFSQFNVAWLKKPLDHPDMADFKNGIDPIHELADKAPGFVWRLIADGHSSAITLRPLGEDCLLNFTIWESREAMANWVYRDEHADALKRRRDWLHPPMEPSVAMWWLPAGHTPTLEEALDRLQYLRSHGATPLAFAFKDMYTPSDCETYLKEPGRPSLVDPRIGVAQAERCIDAYIAVWNEPDAERRMQKLARVMTDDGVYCDPVNLAQGRTALAHYIAQVQVKYAGGRIERTSTVDVHHYNCRFNWRVVKSDGTPLPESLDIVEFARDGRIRRVTGFFGTPSAHSAS